MTDTRLTINPITRTIAPKYRNQKAVYVAKNDHNSVRICFEIPKCVDGHDMSAKDNVIHIHYANVGENTSMYSRGVSDAVEVNVEKDEITQEEIVSFCWLVPNTATRYAGVVSIGVTFERYENVDGKAKEVYSWSTSPYGKIIVWDSMDNTSETVEREYNYLVETCNAIVESALDTDLHYLIEGAETARNEAEKALTKAVEAQGKAEIAKGETVTAKNETISARNEAISYAVGGTGTREGENEDNAKYYAELVKGEKEYAQFFANEAGKSENLAYSYAVGNTGSREGEDEDNAKYYKEQAEIAKNEAITAKESAENALKETITVSGHVATTAQCADDYKEQSKSYAVQAETAKTETENARDEAISAKNETVSAKDEVLALKDTLAPSNFANALKKTVSGTNAVAMKDVSPVEHNISVKLSSVKNMIDNEAFLSSSSPFMLTGEVGKTYTFSFGLKEGIDVSKIIFVSIRVNRGDGEGFVDFADDKGYNTNLIRADGVMNKSVTITFVKDCTYQWQFGSRDYTTFGEIFEWVKQVEVVKAYGKNILNFTKVWTSSGSRYVFPLNLPNATMTISLEVNALLGTVKLQKSIDGGATWKEVENLLVENKQTYTETFTQNNGEQYRVQATGSGKNSITNIQVELGKTATDIEEYKTPIEYTPNEDGTVEVKSIYPSTTLVANGSDIAATYNRDLNKVIDDIYSKILELA